MEEYLVDMRKHLPGDQFKQRVDLLTSTYVELELVMLKLDYMMNRKLGEVRELEPRRQLIQTKLDVVLFQIDDLMHEIVDVRLQNELL